MSNKWMTADEWRETVGAAHAAARKRAEEENEERLRAAVDRGVAAFYAELAAVTPHDKWVSTKIGTDRDVACRVAKELCDRGWRAAMDDGENIIRVTVTLPK